ncbi:MAG: PP2C family protein-serine/threonine phosphatase [Bacteroidia bacterium]
MEDKKIVKIVLVEDNPHDAGLITRELERSGMLFEILIVKNKNEFEREIDAFSPDIILSDHTLPGFSSVEAFGILKKRSLIIPFILITGSVSEEFAVECLKAGMSDYILKSSLKRLPSSIQNILQSSKIKREKMIIEALHTELKRAYNRIAEKNKDIMDSIVYAKGIQTAMLPEKRKLKDVFPDSFIYYQPRDIVSGDFYWFVKQNHKFLIAAADCTGHGVPGALMSVIGIELLNKIIVEKRITYPSDILRNLNVGVTRFFNQQENETRDGMDIAVCSIDLSNKTIEYAGANRPVWLIRNSIMEEVKPSKNPVGGGEEPRIYVSHKVSYESGDRLYLFTDGITDQFGGFDDRKLMKKKLKKLLVASRSLTLDDQRKVLEDFLNTWKGENKQVDDMLAIGIKL